MQTVFYTYFTFFSLLFPYSSSVAIIDIDWCKFTCTGQVHTVCRRGLKCPLSNGCEQHNNFNKNEKDYILELHNVKRNRVATGKEARIPIEVRRASDMNALSWDVHLEYVARCHARECVFKHDECRSTPKFAYVGQNLFFQHTKNAQYPPNNISDNAVNGWFSEINNIPNGEMYKEFLGKDNIGHYSQIIWAKTTHIGCAMTRHLLEDEKTFEYFLVCNYGMGGNIRGQPIYEYGEPCSFCRGKTCNEKYPGLCGEIELAKKCPCES